jgi:hypothetical protein
MNPAKKYSEEIMREMIKREFNKGRDWTRDGLKEMTAQKRMVKSTVENVKGGAFVYYHLPTVLEHSV